METLAAFLDMGGYAAYVWPAYGLAFVALGGIVIITQRSLKAREAAFDALKRERRGGATP